MTECLLCAANRNQANNHVLSGFSSFFRFAASLWKFVFVFVPACYSINKICRSLQGRSESEHQNNGIKNSRSKERTNNNLNQQETASTGIQPGSQRWEASGHPLHAITIFPRNMYPEYISFRIFVICGSFRVAFPDIMTC